MTPEELTQRMLLAIVEYDRGDMHVSDWRVDYDQTEANMLKIAREAFDSLQSDIELARGMIHDLKSESSAYHIGLQEGASEEKERCVKLLEKYAGYFEKHHGWRIYSALHEDIKADQEEKARDEGIPTSL